MQDPAFMISGRFCADAFDREALSAGPHVWLPGTITVLPFSAVKSSMAQIMLTLSAGRGRGTL